MSNRAAWLTGKQVYPLVVKDAPYTQPKDDEVLIKVRYAAANPGILTTFKAAQEGRKD
jgi:NADPH:quinone reductase-like Zn-dependent oxidoreductase